MDDVVAQLKEAIGRVDPLAGGWVPSYVAKGLRTRAEITQREASAAIGCGLTTLAAWENGRAVPSLRMRRRWRQYLAILAGAA